MSCSSVCAVIVSGGSGTRFGNPGGKQLVNVAGRPLMTWSIMAFDRSSLVERMGGSVRCVESPRDNLKVTLPEDLRPVTAILLGRMSDAESAQDTGIIARSPLA